VRNGSERRRSLLGSFRAPSALAATASLFFRLPVAFPGTAADNEDGRTFNAKSFVVPRCI
jgi:hypothetical protein